jgi:pilus assembly protein CpaB
MRRGRIFFYLAFIIILGVVAFILVMQRYPQLLGGGRNVTVEPTPVIQTTNVIVVTQRVPRGTAVTGSVLGMVPIPQDLFIDGMFANIAEVEGKLAKFDLEAGIPLTRGMLADSAEQLSGTGSVAALSIPRGMVAISIPISRLSSVSYAPQAGDHVNVIVAMMLVDLDQDFQTALPNRNIGVLGPGTGTGSLTGTAGQSSTGNQQEGSDSTGTAAEIQTSSVVAVSGGGGGLIGRATSDNVLGQTFYQVPSEEQRPRLVSQNLLQDAVVLQVGDFPYNTQQETAAPVAEPTAPAEPAAEGQAAPTAPPAPDIITLIVSPQDAITINYLLYGGAQLTLALRPAQDDTRVETESVTLQYLLDQYEITVPAKLPTGVEPAVRELAPPVLKNDVLPTPQP